MDKKIYLDYDPKYQGIIKTAAYMMFACTAIFLVQVVLLISNTQLFGYAGIGDWDKFLRMIDTNAIPFIVINLNFIALRVLYIVVFLGYIVATWNLNKSAALSYLGFALVSLPVILVSHVFQLSLTPLAHEYVKAAINPGSTEALSYLINAKMVYTMTDWGDAFVAIVLFNGLLISWLFIAFKKPHPKYYGWWILLLIVLPIGRFVGLPILGLANAFLTALFILVTGIMMLRFTPAQNRL